MPFFALPTGGASPILTTNGSPTGSLGNLGDLAIDKADAEVKLYGPKENAGWPTGIALRGPTGGYAFAATGPTAPALTLAGAVWLDDTTGKYFVRYENNWIEIGVQGERGPTGPVPRAGVVAADATGPIDLVDTSPRYHFYNNVDLAVVKLPTGVPVGFDLVITETGGIADIPIETTTATGVATINANNPPNPQSVLVVWDGSTWRLINLW